MPTILEKLLICLFTAHISGDFLFQPDKIAKNKKRLLVVLLHSLIMGALTYVICGDWTNWIIPVAMFISHLLIDGLKALVKKDNLLIFILDQTFHVAIIIILAKYVFLAQVKNFYWLDRLGKDVPGYLILFMGMILVTKTSGLVIAYILAPFEKKIDETKKELHGRGFDNGGKVIGYLERMLIFLLLLMNEPAGIGFLITAKTLFRFGEIREKGNRLEVEYILIGTLLSFFMAIVISLLSLIVASRYITSFSFNLLSR